MWLAHSHAAWVAEYLDHYHVVALGIIGAEPERFRVIRGGKGLAFCAVPDYWIDEDSGIISTARQLSRPGTFSASRLPQVDPASVANVASTAAIASLSPRNAI